MNNNFNINKISNQKTSSKNSIKKDNIITSLSEVECFLNSLNCIFSGTKLVNIMKKFK